MLDNLSSYRIVLASNSPRRRELLSGLGLDFTVRVPRNCDESYPAGLQGSEIARHIALSKAESCRAEMRPDELVITADTIVCLDGKVYGKPENEEDACRMLRELSGRQHHVYTGVCLMTSDRTKSFVADSAVTFAPLDEAEIDWYVRHCHPLDKAGAYGVQEWIGHIGVCDLSGSYFNVMGLPVQQLYRELKQF